jgi:drug/metabolite transporter (DMT)-like permease
MTGILFALGALVAWGFGDFFIQRSVRAVGIWKSLLLIDAVGIIALFPFVVDELGALFANSFHLGLLILASIVILLTALAEFESLRRGKLAIVEPILSLELPLTVLLAIVVWGERVALPQLILAGVAFFGITLAVTEHHTHLHYHRRIKVEKGVIFAGLGAIGMGIFNFLVGVGSQEISPLMTIWFTNILTVAFTFFYLQRRGELHKLFHDFRQHIGILASVCVLDNLAWISFAVATTFIPIAIATTLSESYVALAVLLGVFANKERLRWHQIVGVVVTLASVIFLSAISS